jgi:hypothetical protein
MPGEWHPDSGVLPEVDGDSFDVGRRVAAGQESGIIHMSADFVCVDTAQHTGNGIQWVRP